MPVVFVKPVRVAFSAGNILCMNAVCCISMSCISDIIDVWLVTTSSRNCKQPFDISDTSGLLDTTVPFWRSLPQERFTVEKNPSVNPLLTLV